MEVKLYTARRLWLIMQDYRILTINPGSTSTKIGVFHNDQMIFDRTIRYEAKELSVFETIYNQYEFRKNPF